MIIMNTDLCGYCQKKLLKHQIYAYKNMAGDIFVYCCGLHAEKCGIGEEELTEITKNDYKRLKKQ